MSGDDPQRPWSFDEITVKLPGLLERAEQMIIDLRALGDTATRKKWAYEKAKATAMLHVVAQEAESGIRSNKELREAKAVLFIHKDHPGRSRETGEVTKSDKSTAQLGYEADLADRAYQDQKSAIRSLDSEISVMQSMMVSARNAMVTR